MDGIQSGIRMLDKKAPSVRSCAMVRQFCQSECVDVGDVQSNADRTLSDFVIVTKLCYSCLAAIV